MQLSKVFWEAESVLALNKKLKVPIRFQVLNLVLKHFWSPETLYSIAHDLALTHKLVPSPGKAQFTNKQGFTTCNK